MSDLYKVLTISEWENANENGFIDEKYTTTNGDGYKITKITPMNKK